jgi:hypothetical protein
MKCFASYSLPKLAPTRLALGAMIKKTFVASKGEALKILELLAVDRDRGQF